jgi:hypothetical protein
VRRWNTIPCTAVAPCHAAFCPVLIISGFAEAEGIAPDIARLTKPFRQADLATMLANVIARATMDLDDTVADRGKVPAH